MLTVLGSVGMLKPHAIRVTQGGNDIEIVAITRDNPLEGRWYSWRSEMRPRDHEILMGLLLADEGAVHPKARSTLRCTSTAPHDRPIDRSKLRRPHHRRLERGRPNRGRGHGPMDTLRQEEKASNR